MTKRHCSKCGRAGHYVSTCSASRPKSKPKAKKPGGRKSKQGLWLGDAYQVVLVNTLPGHNKSWAAKVVSVGSGKYAIVTRYGKINGQKNEYRKIIGNREAATKEFHRLVLSKLIKGYESTGRL